MKFGIFKRFVRHCPFSTSTIPEKLPLRKPNNYTVESKDVGKLEKLTRPFKAILREPKEVSSPLGFGLQNSDINSLELKNSDLVKKLVSMEMCSLSEMKRHQIHQAMQLFCRSPNDTGSPEVQAAIWSVKIASLEEHVKKYRHDYPAERKIVDYKDQRRKILRYLKRVSLERYFECLDRLGLPHDLVEAATSKFPRMPIKKPKSPEGLRKLMTRKRK